MSFELVQLRSPCLFDIIVIRHLRFILCPLVKHNVQASEPFRVTAVDVR